MAAASQNGRTPETVRREIAVERQELEHAVEQLRSVGVSGTLRGRLPVAAAGALGAGFFLAGGIGATMRFLARKGRER
jgi:hypothetical protein